MNGRGTSRSRRTLAHRGGAVHALARAVPEETAVALVYNGSTQAVMMATPADLEDFAVGFSLTEGIVAAPDEIQSVEIVAHPRGIEAQLWVDEARAERLGARRRAMAGPVGCGLCGIDSLEEAARAVPAVGGDTLRLPADEVRRAVAALGDHQPLHDRTRAVHAAGLWRAGEGFALVREDVGRHNALDKLIGAAAVAGIDTAGTAVVLTSRVSVEMVQKAAAAGIPVIVAVSSPTAEALRVAESAGITVAANARGDGFDLFTRPERIEDTERSDVA